MRCRCRRRSVAQTQERECVNELAASRATARARGEGTNHDDAVPAAERPALTASLVADPDVLGQGRDRPTDLGPFETLETVNVARDLATGLLLDEERELSRRSGHMWRRREDGVRLTRKGEHS